MYGKIRMIEQTFEIEYNVKKKKIGGNIISEKIVCLLTNVYKFGEEQLNDNYK